MDSTNQVMQRNIEALADIARIIESTPYGDVTVSFKTHSNRVTSLFSQEFIERNYKEGENHIALADIIKQIKDIHDKKENATISLTLIFNAGKIRKVINQEQKKSTYVK